MDIKFPDLLGLGGKEIIVFKKLPDLDQEVRVDQVDLVVCLFCLFFEVVAVIFQDPEHRIAGIQVIV